MRLHAGPKTHLLRRSIAELEQELDPAVFCRIHRSTIVNLSRVRSLQLGADGEYEVLLSRMAPRSVRAGATASACSPVWASAIPAAPDTLCFSFSLALRCLTSPLCATLSCSRDSPTSSFPHP